jgi:ATP-dependent Clp protease ATP-binding subunit ClpA
VGPPPVVGRERELAAVRAFLERGRDVLVLEGEAGIGKTTVWQAGLEAAGDTTSLPVGRRMRGTAAAS